MCNNRQVIIFKNAANRPVYDDLKQEYHAWIPAFNGKKIRLTSYRDAQSGTGINNPRIKKIRGFC